MCLLQLQPRMYDGLITIGLLHDGIINSIAIRSYADRLLVMAACLLGLQQFVTQRLIQPHHQNIMCPMFRHRLMPRLIHSTLYSA
jgi:hypothetical protein